MDTKGKSTEIRASTLESTRFNVRYIEKERKRLSIVQFPLYSALGCLIPFLTAHMSDIGLTAKQSALITAITGLISILGPLVFGPIAHRYSKYNLIICCTLLLSTILYTSLLFVPRVLITPKHSSILFDCTNGELLIERCANWEGNCGLHPKRLAWGNFTNFTLYQCKYNCESNSSLPLTSLSPPFSSSLSSANYIDPIQVCFESSSEGTLCLESSESPKPTASSANPINGKIADPIQFDSRFDRWPFVGSRSHLQGNSHLTFCSFQPNEALIIKSQSYQSIACRPSAPSCTINCRADLVHRSHSLLTSPLPCYKITGRPQVTFYSYLALRSIADLALFTGFSLIDCLAITLTNDFDSIYGRTGKLLSIVLPLSLWPVGSGILVDYFSLVTKRPDYSPVFVIYNGFIFITIILIVCFPVSPISKDNLIAYTSLSQSDLETKNNNGNNKSSTLRSTRTTGKQQKIGSSPSESGSSSSMSIKRKLGVITMFPLITLLGTQWGLLHAYLPSYYLELGVNKMWLGLASSLAFLAYSPFCVIIKSLTAGLGRVHLIVLGLIFYSIRLSGISFLHSPRWTLIPFQSMEAFTLPLTWIGLTSFVHRLVPSSATGLHLVIHYSLILFHFGIGRALGGFLWWLWLKDWDDNHDRWNWLIYDWPLIQITVNYDLSAYRLLLRLTAIISGSVGLVILTFYHICCRPYSLVTGLQTN